VTQPNNPQTQPQSSSQPSSSLKDKIDKFLNNLFGILDIIGRKILGDLWETLYLSVQDAIASGLLIQIPSQVGSWIIGDKSKNFTGLTQCSQAGDWGSIDRYVCYVMVISEFTLWAVLAARILIRFIQDLRKLRQPRGGRNAP
jgi:hypothetical protein